MIVEVIITVAVGTYLLSATCRPCLAALESSIGETLTPSKFELYERALRNVVESCHAVCMRSIHDEELRTFMFACANVIDVDNTAYEQHGRICDLHYEVIDVESKIERGELRVTDLVKEVSAAVSAYTLVMYRYPDLAPKKPSMETMNAEMVTECQRVMRGMESIWSRSRSAMKHTSSNDRVYNACQMVIKSKTPFVQRINIVRLHDTLSVAYVEPVYSHYVDVLRKKTNTYANMYG